MNVQKCDFNSLHITSKARSFTISVVPTPEQCVFRQSDLKTLTKKSDSTSNALALNTNVIHFGVKLAMSCLLVSMQAAQALSQTAKRRSVFGVEDDRSERKNGSL